MGYRILIVLKAIAVSVAGFVTATLAIAGEWKLAMIGLAVVVIGVFRINSLAAKIRSG